MVVVVVEVTVVVVTPAVVEVVVELEPGGTTVYWTETVPLWPSLLVAITEYV